MTVDARDPTDEMATKILHTADWHLGARYLGFGDGGTRLSQQRLQTVRRILGVAERYGVHALVVAGDVFDGPEPGEGTWRGLVDALAEQRWHDRIVVLLPGNHDPLTATSIWRNRAFLGALPPWVHVVDRDEWSLPLGEDAVLHAVPCRRAAGQLDLTAKLPARERGDERVRIAVLHGQTAGFAGHAPNFHIAPDTATRLGFDYVALGDTHALRCHAPPSAPMIYPGTPEPTRFGETEAGNVAVVLLPRRRGTAPIVQFEPVGHYRWEQREVTSLAQLQALRDEDLRTTVLRLSVRMRLPAAEHAIADGILRELVGDADRSARTAMIDIDRAGLQLDTRTLLVELDDLPEQVREAARRLQAIADGPDREHALVAERALVHLYGMAREGGLVRATAEPTT
ncbi:MAG: DNA repair exonuclease [Nannocystaceae bacterium]|nr:DNA repair exonuclease [Nannocystaceae bacterium]